MINRDTISMIVRKMSAAERDAVLAAKAKSAAAGHGSAAAGHGDAAAKCAGALGNEDVAEPSTDENIVASLVKGHEIVLNDINNLLDDLAAKNQTIALWGASHQGFTLASTTPLCERVSYIIDSAPFKQGRFAPASHLPIVPPDHFLENPVDVIMIVAPGYSDEIAGVIRTRFGEKVRILTLRSERIEEL